MSRIGKKIDFKLFRKLNIHWFSPSETIKKLNFIVGEKKLSLTSKAEIKNIDHLGIVAGLIDEIGIVETINSKLGIDPREKISCREY